MTDDTPQHPLNALREQAEQQRKRQEKERVHCPECDVEVLKDDIEDALDAAAEHDETRHDGERTTKVNGLLPPGEDVVEAARDALDSIRGDSR